MTLRVGAGGDTPGISGRVVSGHIRADAIDISPGQSFRPGEDMVKIVHKKRPKINPTRKVVLNNKCASGDGNPSKKFVAVAVMDEEETPRTMEFSRIELELCQSCYDTLMTTLTLLGVDISSTKWNYER